MGEQSVDESGGQQCTGGQRFSRFLGYGKLHRDRLLSVLTMLNLSSIQDETGQIWVASLATTATVATTAYGNYTILKTNVQKGGKINIAGGIVLIIMYSYFSGFSQPKLLEWLNPYGIVLAIPSVLSGAIGLTSSSKSDGESMTDCH